MAPIAPRRQIAKDKIAAEFAKAKTQQYVDPAARSSTGHTIRTIAWSPLGTLIATGSVDRTLRIWNPDKPNVKNSTELRGHTGAVERVAWNPTRDAELASVSHDGTAKFWDVRSRSCLATVNIGGEGLTIAWSPDGKLVMVGRKDDVLVPIGVPEGGRGEYTVYEHIPQSQQTNQVIFAPVVEGSGRYVLLLTTGSGTIKICSYPMRPVEVHGAAATTTSVAAKANGNGTLTTSIANGNATPNPDSQQPTSRPQSQPQTPSTLTPLHVLSSHTSSCFCLELSSTGRYLATGGSDALICLWDTTEWVCRRSLDKMAGAVRGLGFSWDGAYVVGSSDEGTGLEVAHVETGEYVFTVSTGNVPAPCVAWHPNRYWLAFSGDSGGLKIFGAAGGPL